MTRGHAAWPTGLSLALACAGVAIVGPPAPPDPPCLLGTEPGPSWVVDLEGDVAIVRRTVYRFDSTLCGGPPCQPWVAEATFTPGGTSSQTLGAAICGDVAAVSGDDDGDGQAEVHVFRYDAVGGTWNPEAVLLPFGAALAENFGMVLDIDGDVLIAGCFYPSAFAGPGAAWIFRYDGAAWQPEAELTPDDGGPGDRFGASLAIEGDVAVIGAYSNDEAGPQAGAVYVYRRQPITGQWMKEAKLITTPADASVNLALAVDVSGDVIVAGDARQVGNDIELGSRIYRYDGSSWEEEATFIVGLGFESVFLPVQTVKVRGSTHLLASLDETNANGRTGVVLVIEHDGQAWSVVEEIRSPLGDPNDWFGFASDFDGEHLIVAAPSDGVDDPLAVTHFYLRQAGDDCNNNGVADPCDILTGTSEDLDLDGIPDECPVTPGDIDGDGIVDLVDVLALLAAWGPCDLPCPPTCPGDFDIDCTVSITDLLVLLANWS